MFDPRDCPSYGVVMPVTSEEGRDATRRSAGSNCAPYADLRIEPRHDALEPTERMFA